MLSFKKVYRDELLQIALILSLLRVNQDSIYENDILNVGNFDFDNGTSWRSSLSPSVLRSHFINPKSLDSVLLNYEREIFADLNSLGRYNRGSFRYPNVTAYLLNIERSAPLSPASEAIQNLPNAGNLVAENEVANENQNPTNEIGPPPLENGIELTQEEMDLIEVLWKQDVDLGFSLDKASSPQQDKQETAEDSAQIIGPTTSIIPGKDIHNEKSKDIEAEDKIKEEPEGEKNDDPWAGLEYTIDTETGEYVKKEEQSDCGPTCDLPLGDLSLPIPEFLLDEALRLCELDDENSQELTLNLKELENLSLDTASADNSNSSVSDPILPQTSSISDDTTKSPDVDSAAKEAEDELDILSDMIQTPQFHHPHHHHRAFHQSRMPFVRSVSMDQRWQDLASLLSLNGSTDGSGIPHPFSHHHSLHNYSHPHHGMGYGPDAARGVLLHNATLTPPMGDINSTVPYSNIGGTNLGNAVATSMNLTNSSEPMGEPSASGHYKLEPTHDMMYYQQNGTELNQTDGFLSSILNDEDLQLMDMGVGDGMYGMRMLDNSSNAISNLTMNNATNAAGMSRSEVERMDTSSDSAVSSMGSERVPSLSDGEWCDAGSDSGHTTTGEHYVTDYHSKLRPYDYNGFSNRQLNINGDITRIPSGAQKKHQMYGKRYFQDQGNSTPSTATASHQAPVKYEYHRDNSTASSYNSSQPESGICAKQSEMKYSCSIEFGRQNSMPRSMDHIQHNHTYHLPAESTGAMQRPVSRDKKPSSRGKTEEEHLTRDEKRARALNVPISVDDIINLPMDEFNERLSKYDLSEAQLSLIRDIRRRGKNKVAAQNCRKRKLDQILSLADEVKEMRDRKIQLKNDYEYVVSERKRMNEKYQQLYRHVFQNLRDPDGNQYSPYQYVLQASADGSILMVPRSNSNSSDRKDPPQGYKD